MSQTTHNVYDLVISGAGIPGASLALAGEQAGLRVALIDARPGIAAGLDSRTTALLPESLAFLDSLGVLSPIRDQAQPLQAMRLINDQGPARDAPAPLVFEGPGGQPLAYNVPNRVVAAALEQALARRVETYWQGSVTRAWQTGAGRTARACLALDEGTVLTARLCALADGRASPLRALLGIGWRNLSAGQTALTARLQHGRCHEGMATEFHRTAGPMTFVPLPGDGHASALVWCQRAALAQTLKGLDAGAFLRRAQIASQGILGDLHTLENRADFAVRPGLAHQFSKGPFVLLAEAAHVLPPLLAQGMNLSLSDVAAVQRAVARFGPGPEAAAAYGRARWTDTLSRLGISQGLNQVLQRPLLARLYAAGHRALTKSPGARALAVQIGQRGHQTLPDPDPYTAKA